MFLISNFLKYGDIVFFCKNVFQISHLKRKKKQNILLIIQTKPWKVR